MIPIFTSQYSGKSILTFDPPDKAKKNHKQSIVAICKKAGITQPFIVDEKMTGFMEMYENCTEEGIAPRFGLRYAFNNGGEDEDNQKITIFLKNTDGYRRLIRIHNTANRENGAVISPDILNEYWSDDDLMLAIPFYDSYIYSNLLTPKTCYPPAVETAPAVFLIEDNGLPFDGVITNHIKNMGETLLTKSIYYENREDFNTWLTYRCALNLAVAGKRRSLEEPNFDHCASNEFCWESYQDYVQTS